MQHPIYTIRNQLLDKAMQEFILVADHPNYPNFIFAMKRFEGTTWKLVKDKLSLSDSYTPLERAFFDLYKLGVRPPYSVSALYAALKDHNNNSGE